MFHAPDCGGFPWWHNPACGGTAPFPDLRAAPAARNLGAMPADPAAAPPPLQRFLAAQAAIYPEALAELRAGRKRSHWMWFVFPQVAGLGTSATARRYAIGSRAEAAAYLAHPILGARLRECAAALLGVHDRTAEQILGSPDHLKLRSSMTLFAALAEPGSPFAAVLARYYAGRACDPTQRFLAAPPPSPPPRPGRAE